MSFETIVREIAQTRFGLEDWDVATSPIPGAVRGQSPEIMAEHGGEVVATGVVETTDTISDERARQWKSFGEGCVRFYLYVPDGVEEEVARLIAKHQVECAGVRCYRYNGKLEVNPVHMDNTPCRDDNHQWWKAIGATPLCHSDLLCHSERSGESVPCEPDSSLRSE